jgi:hypothetical protein
LPEDLGPPLGCRRADFHPREAGVVLRLSDGELLDPK